jgi:hypothetical protein
VHVLGAPLPSPLRQDCEGVELLTSLPPAVPTGLPSAANSATRAAFVQAASSHAATLSACASARSAKRLSFARCASSLSVALLALATSFATALRFRDLSLSTFCSSLCFAAASLEFLISYAAEMY